MSERRCRNCANFEEEEPNFWTCSAGEFTNEPGDEVRESEFWNHCGRKYSPAKKSYDEGKHMSKFEQYLTEASIKDLLNKIEDDFELTSDEMQKLLDKGLVSKNGKPTQKAKEQFSSLY